MLCESIYALVVRVHVHDFNDAIVLIRSRLPENILEVHHFRGLDFVKIKKFVELIRF